MIMITMIILIILIMITIMKTFYNSMLKIYKVND